MKAVRVTLASLLLLAAAHGQPPPDNDELSERIDATLAGGSGDSKLYALFDLMWDTAMREFPEGATYVGYAGQNDRWVDDSFGGVERRKAQTRLFHHSLNRIDVESLSADARLDRALIVRQLAEEIDGHPFPQELLALTQLNGVHLDPSRILAVMPATGIGDYHDILARLRALPELIRQNQARLERGLEKGITPPSVTLRDVPGQIRSMMPDNPTKSPLYATFSRIPEIVPVAVADSLRRVSARILTENIYPAYAELTVFFEDYYLPGARQSIAFSDLPEGEAWYDYRVRRSTTTLQPARKIHEIGLSEVKRLRAEMDVVIAEIGFTGSFAEFARYLRTDDRFFYDSAEELLAGYREICKAADPELVRLFGRLPRLPYGVKAVPAYAEQSAPTGHYELGSLEAGRPGYFYANTYDLHSRPKWEMRALALHEAVPGHHLQISLAQERSQTHDLIRYNHYTAFGEGWGLYAESLGEEMGLYKDPYDRFGKLTYEMWRAVRLVVDTGMHSMGWSREQAIEFFAANATRVKRDIIVEVDRYIAWPGQALAYKMGELKIKALRAHATAELGDRFDVRAFHDQVLGRGALPLDLLDIRIRDWVRSGGK
ncbi:MAG: DUF885 domain-containing protein [Candidatus Latescibacterota bacterium]|nr:DUF885 domain-containing protein [Candidatus Latescibacterota bacterium]